MRQRFMSTPINTMVTDENNNEIGVVEPAPAPRTGNGKAGFALAFVATIAITAGLLQGANAGVLQGTQPKLNQIMELSKAAGSASATWANKMGDLRQEEICYEDGCLDTALDLLKAANLSVDPCEDFFQFACGRWLASNPVPPSASRWSRFNGLRDEVNRITQEILTEATNVDDPKPVNQVKQFYDECTDVAKLEAAGLTPVLTLISELGGWPLLNPGSWDETEFDWVQTLGEIRRRLVDDPLISVYADRDYKNTSRNLVYLDQPSFGLPRSVLINAANYEAILAAYRTYIVEVAQALESTETLPQLELAAAAMIDLEIKLAGISLSDEDRYDVDLIYNPYKLNEFQAASDAVDPTFSIDWKKLLDQIFSTSGVTIAADEQIIAAGKSYLLSAIPILKATPKRVIADYLGFRVAGGLISETTESMRAIIFKFTQALTGAKEPATRDSSCAGSSNGNFGMAIGVKYIEAAFDKEAKALVDALVENLRVAFKGLVTDADWMQDSTKTEAQAKADTIRSFMAFPEWLDDKDAVEAYFAGLELATGADAHFKTALSIALWASDRTLANLRVPTTQDEWLTYPGVVNAFYSPQHNSITFPAGILQPPFFGKTRPASQNYGGIGVVIGHEITHGFDNQGAQFDKDGNAFNWWDDVTKDNFNTKKQCIVDQYSDFYIPNIDMNVNGDLTQGENIADNGGLRESFRAYRQYIAELGHEEGRLPGLEMLSPNQLFFLGYANIWCESITDEGLVNQILTDPHSPAQFRVIGPLRNSMDFATAYSCPLDGGMNPPESEKCTVW